MDLANARISVMGGEQAAGVLATVRRDGLEARGEEWSAEDEEAFKAPVREQYERQGAPLLRDRPALGRRGHRPADTRTVLGLALSAVSHAPLEEVGYGVFRCDAVVAQAPAMRGAVGSTPSPAAASRCT